MHYRLLTLLFVGAYGCFAVFSGGDWMEGGRFLVPFLPAAFCLLGSSLADVGWRRPVRLAALALVLLQLSATLHFAFTRSTGLILPDALAYARSYARQRGASGHSWFERTNLVHARDLPTLQVLERTVEDLLGRSASHPEGHRLTLASGQMGLLPYYLARRFPDRLRFLDLRGLVESTFTTCPATSDLPRVPEGLGLTWEVGLDRWDALWSQCHPGPPDILFDLGLPAPLLARLEERGYAIIYRQTGTLPARDLGLAPRQLPAAQFVAVRREWLEPGAIPEAEILDVRALLPLP